MYFIFLPLWQSVYRKVLFSWIAIQLVLLFLLVATGYFVSPVLAGKSKSSPKIHYSIKDLPPLVRKMHREIYRAARSGDLELMQEVLELNELLPAINDSHTKDPVGQWKKESMDGGALSVFAAMSRILEAGYVRRKTGTGSALYIWPYFAETDITELGQLRKMQLFRMVPPGQAVAMVKSGKYRFYSLGIGEDGTWHYFRKH